MVSVRNKPVFTVIIVNYKSSHFIKLSLFALDRLSYYRHLYLIADNFSSEEESQQLKLLKKNYSNLKIYTIKNQISGNLAHAKALDFLLAKVQTKYVVIMDADAVWLHKHWDRKLISRINATTKIYGTQASGNKPKDFPLMFAMISETHILKELKISFLPDNKKKLDTGYELREKFTRHKYKGEVLNAISSRDRKTIYQDIICTLYYFENELIASHFGRGSSQGQHKYKSNTNFLFNIPFIGKTLRMIKGKRQAYRWIAKSKEIISNQVEN